MDDFEFDFDEIPNPKLKLNPFKIVLIVYNENEIMKCDIYLKGIIKNHGFIKNVCDEAVEDVIDHHVRENDHMRSQKVVHFNSLILEDNVKPSKQIMRKKGIIIDENFKLNLKSVEKYETKPKYIRFIKKLMEEIPKQSSPDVELYSSDSDLENQMSVRDVESRIELESASLATNEPEIRISTSKEEAEAKIDAILLAHKAKLGKLIQIVESDESKMESTKSALNTDMIDEEMTNNINMLEQIGYITKGNYTIKGDKVVLNHPVGHAVGDFIKNRNDSYMSKDPNYGLSYKISRIHAIDIS
jgi:hypothetical protein